MSANSARLTASTAVTSQPNDMPRMSEPAPLRLPRAARDAALPELTSPRVDRERARARNEERETSTRDREVLEEVIELVRVRKVGVRQQCGDHHEDRNRER